MWKRLDQKIATSEKHTKFGFSPLTLWVMMLPHTDSKGRYWANASFIKGQCLPLFEHVRLEQVDRALLDLQEIKLIHLYDSEDGKRYLVYHDVEDFNPPGALRYTKPQWPAPPDDLCKCLQRRESGVLAPLVTSPSSSTSSSPPYQPPPEPTDGRFLPSSPVGQILELMRRKKIRGGKDQLRNAAEGWIAKKNFEFCQELFTNGKVDGWDVFEVSNTHFANAKTFEPVFTPAKTKCANCGGSGKVAGGVDGETIKLVPCTWCASGPRKAVAQ